MLSTFFSTLAASLACVGLYGVMSIAVRRRTREIGIHIALGAQRRWVSGLVMREAVGRETRRRVGFDWQCGLMGPQRCLPDICCAAGLAG